MTPLTAQDQLVRKTYLDLAEERRDNGRISIARETGLSIGKVGYSLRKLRKRPKSEGGLPPRFQGAHLPREDVDAPTLASESYTETGNTALLVTTKEENPRTLEDLVRVCKIDLKIWQVERWQASKWSTMAKVGVKGRERIVETPLYRIKAWLVRRVAQRVVSEIPPLQTAQFTVKGVSGKKTTRTGLQTAFMVSDPHVGFLQSHGALEPFHDRRAISATLQLVRAVQPGIIVVLGDLMDLPEFTDKYLKSPEFYFTFQPTLFEAGWLLAQLRAAAPRAKIHLLPGNHDDRIRKAIFTHLWHVHDILPANQPDSQPILSLDHLLGLKRLKIQCAPDYPHGKVWLSKDLCIRHGEEVSIKSGGTVGKTLDKFRQHQGYGHAHRLELAHRTFVGHPDEGPLILSAASFGSLVRIDGPVPAHSAEKNWQNGCGIIYFDTQHPPQIDPVLIHRGRLIWKGMAIQGKDYTEQLSRDTGWNYG